MSRRRRGGVGRELTALAMLGVLVILFLPQLRVVGIVVMIVVAGVGAGVLLYRLNSLKSSQPFGGTNFVHQSGSAAILPFAPPAQLQQHSGRTDFNPSSSIGEGELLRSLQSLDWFQFEKVMAAVFESLGGKVTRRGGANPDGGIDLIVVDDLETIAVQCKHWRTWKIKEPTVREFLGAMTHEGIKRGLLLTLCGYTAEAKRLADAHNIEILPEDKLLSLIESAKVADGPRIVAVLVDRRKLCPKCEAQMVERVSTKNFGRGNRFWGCSRYPRCRFTMPISSEAAGKRDYDQAFAGRGWRG